MKSAPLTEMMEDFQNGAYDMTKDGKCTGCGACCSAFLPMTDKEIATIRRYIKVNHIKEKRHNFPLSQVAFDATCPFLDESKGNEKCVIYSVRPEVCRKFICDPKQRPSINEEYAGSVRIVNLRSEFYG